jgi:transcriptional/translational regulatory protein YebC/TACO1
MECCVGEGRRNRAAGCEVEFVPQNYVRLEGADARQMFELMEAPKITDDVQKVYANFDSAKGYGGQYTIL